MAYIVIVFVTYIVVGFMRFFAMSQKMAQTAERFRESGSSQQDIDQFYKSMGGPTLVALVAFVAVAGTGIAAAICIGYWFVTR